MAGPEHIHTEPPRVDEAGFPLDLERVEREMIPQELQFMADLLPIIHSLVSGWPREQPMAVVDIGAGSGAGAGLLASLFAGPLVGPVMRVTALEIAQRFPRYARRWPRLEYEVGNAWHLPDSGRTFDLAVCSHLIEHFTDPLPFIRCVQSVARQWALFYAPYEEAPLIAEHRCRITREMIDSLSPLRVELIESPAWPFGRCVAFVLPGLAPP